MKRHMDKFDLEAAREGLAIRSMRALGPVVRQCKKTGKGVASVYSHASPRPTRRDKAMRT